MADDDEKGNLVFQKISEYSKEYNEITLDFKDVELVNTAFLNNAVGKIFDRNVFDIGKCNVFVDNMDEMMQDLLKEAIKIAVQKYQKF